MLQQVELQFGIIWQVLAWMGVMRSWVVLGLLDAFGDCCRTAAIPSNEIAVGTAVLMRSPFFLWLLANQFNLP